MIEQKYRTFWPRLGAGFIDGLVFLPLSLIGQFLIYRSESMRLIALWDLFYGWAWLAYSILMHGYKGQTVGKMVCKVKVFDVSGQPLSMRQAVMRDIVPLVSSIIFRMYVFSDMEAYYEFVTADAPDFANFPVWITILGAMNLIWLLLEIITMLSNNKRRAIHDFIARSVVCRIV